MDRHRAGASRDKVQPKDRREVGAAQEARRKDAASRVAELSRTLEELKRQHLAAELPLDRAAAAAAPAVASAPGGLQLGMVAWNTPPTMAMGETAEVELRVTLDEKLFPGLADRVRAGGSTTSEAVELSRDVSAKLESTAFDVKPDGERRQTVRRGRDAVWTWVISPKQKGKQKLLLSITAHVPDGPAIQPLVRTIEVTAGANDAMGSVLEFIVKNWDKLLTVILIPLGAWGWQIYRKQRQAALATPLPALPPDRGRDTS